MPILDPGLRFLRSQTNESLDTLSEGLMEMSLAKRTESAAAQVRVLAQYRGPMQRLTEAGLSITSVAGDVVAGFAEMSSLDALVSLPGLQLLEHSRPLVSDLDLSVPAIGVPAIHTGSPGKSARTGKGVIVGIIDSGIAFEHPSFITGTGNAKRSRILRIWDQSLSAAVGEAPPAGFTYGVEYNQTQITTALNGGASIRHQPANAHGTHVAGIAAGNAKGTPAAPLRLGVAPDADLIIVRNTSGAANLGTSSNTLDAANYIFAVAKALNRPCVINLSQGDYIGAHDGTSLLERGLDALLTTPGRAFVKSAGNAAQDEAHASGKLAFNVPQDLKVGFAPTLGVPSSGTMDLWYSASDRFEIAIIPPTGAGSGTVNAGTSTTLTLANGNQAFIDSSLANPFNGDNRIFVRLLRGSLSDIAPGTWTLRLRATKAGAGGGFHIWAQRGDGLRFQAPHVNRDSTISIPGTAKRVLSIGSFVTRFANGASVGSLSAFSSRGPTRDGRMKPEISAPGEEIISASAIVASQFIPMSGTSMAAPHATGAIALMLQGAPQVTMATIRQRLLKAAVTDAHTVGAPNSNWGHGKLRAV